MDIKSIKICPLYETCPRMHGYDGEQIYADNVPFINIYPYSCLRKKPGRRKSYLCKMQIDLNKITLEEALRDVLRHRKKYTKTFYASEVDDFINKLKEMIKNDGRSSRES